MMEGLLWFLGSLAAGLGVRSAESRSGHSIDDHGSALPPARAFLPLPASSLPTPSSSQPTAKLRLLQFNVLADGLSGLLPDLGGFSRVSEEGAELKWEYRRDLILNELTRYRADVVCVQEVDHFLDFLAPEMERRGYLGLFSPKPCSPCLAVSSRPDGCAMFIRTAALRLVSSTSLTYSSNGVPDNQVAIVAVLEPAVVPHPPPALRPRIVVATTHLKATKTAEGERSRASQVEQLLRALEQAGADLLLDEGSDVVFIIAGDLNARPESTETVPALAYPLIKAGSLGLRSVYNDDIVEYVGMGGGSRPFGLTTEGVYSTWKARWEADAEQERVSKVDCFLPITSIIGLALTCPSTASTTSSTPLIPCGALYTCVPMQLLTCFAPSSSDLASCPPPSTPPTISPSPLTSLCTQ